MAHIAFLGTGLIGAGMIEGLRKRGEAVRVWNRTLDKAKALGHLGVEVSTQAADAVRGASRVHIAVSDDAAVDAVIDSIAGALDKGTPVIDHTTTSPAGTAARHARLSARGISFLHAPVFMSPQACRSSTGIMLASGPRALFDAQQPALAPMTGEAWWLGERADLAASFKLFGNAMILSVAAGLADVLTLARSLDISGQDALTLFTKFKPASTIDIRGPKMAAGEFTPASFEITMARKDLRLMIETVQKSGLPLAVLPAIAARYDTLIAQGHGDKDAAAIAIDSVKK